MNGKFLTEISFKNKTESYLWDSVVKIVIKSRSTYILKWLKIKKKKPCQSNRIHILVLVNITIKNKKNRILWLK